MTKEVFVIRVLENNIGYSPFYLLWALSLVETRKQWQRVTLMQTNREDVGNRYREILIPKPISKAWADGVSSPFKNYFKGIADAKKVSLRQQILMDSVISQALVPLIPWIMSWKINS